MASNTCTECGYQVLSYENSCPLCGNALEEKDYEGGGYQGHAEELDFSGDKFFDEYY